MKAIEEHRSPDIHVVCVAGYYRFLGYHNSVGVMTAQMHPKQMPSSRNKYNKLQDPEKQDLY